MTMLQRSATILLTILALLASPAIAAASVKVSLRATANVDSETITLDQLADITGSSPEAVRDIAALRLGRAPREDSGELMTLSREQINVRLLLGSYDISDYRLTGADKVLIRRVGESGETPRFDFDFGVTLPDIDVEGPKLWDLLDENIQQSLHQAAGGYEWNLGKITDACRAWIIDSLGAEQELLEVSLASAPSREVREYLQSRMIVTNIKAASADERHPNTIECFVEMLVQPFGEVNTVDRVTEKFRFVMTAWQRAYVAALPLQRGQVLNADDVRLDKVKLGHAQTYVTDLDGIVGMELCGNIAEGKALQARQLKKPPLVKRNGTVTFYYQYSMTTERAKALDDGGMDDVIDIEVLRGNTRQILRAQIIGPGKVGPIQVPSSK